LREKADEVLGLFVGGDLKAAIDAHKTATVDKMTLAEALAELNKRAKAKGVPVGSGTGTPLDEPTRLAFVTGLNKAIQDVREASEKANADWLRHIQDNPTLAPVERRLLHEHWKASVNKIEVDWFAFHQASNGDLAALQRRAKELVASLEKLVKEQTSLKPKELKDTLGKLQQDDAKAFEADMPRQIEKLIGLLEVGGEDVSKERKALADALTSQSPRNALINVAGDLRRKVDAKDQQLAKGREFGRAMNTALTKQLKDLSISKVYKEELQKETLDTLAMIDSNDADLLEAARARLTSQAELLSEIAKEPGLYEDNKRELKALGARLAKIVDVLPDTYRSLQADLTTLFVDSKHTAPKAMSDTIKLFDTKKLGVKEAETRMEARKLAIKNQYDPLKKQIEDIWKKHSEVLGDKVGIGSGFFPKEFAAYKDARLAEAAALKGTEAPITDVIKPLQALKDKLDQIESAPDKKVAIAGLNAEEVVNQRQVRDMAAQFEREVKVFKEVTLVQAKAATRADADGDSDLAKSLSSVASAASKLVGPYLKLLGTWLHETKGSQPAPDMVRVKQDFQRARTMLAEAERTARRLIDTPTATNVTGPSKDGLRKLLPKWGERCQAYDAAVRTMVAAMRTAGAPEADPVVKQATEKSAKLVESSAAASEPTLLPPLSPG
jgi:hypothetical protein